MIKVGLIGGGGIASAHIKGYLEHADRIGITAVADAVEQTAAARGVELGATPYNVRSRCASPPTRPRMSARRSMPTA